MNTLRVLQSRRVSDITMNGFGFDPATPHGRMMAAILAGLFGVQARSDQ